MLAYAMVIVVGVDHETQAVPCAWRPKRVTQGPPFPRIPKGQTIAAKRPASRDGKGQDDLPGLVWIRQLGPDPCLTLVATVGDEQALRAVGMDHYTRHHVRRA